MKHDDASKVELLTNGGSDQPGPLDAALQERLRSVCRPFTCREIADLTRVSHESVRRYIGGQNPGVIFLKRLCEVLNLSADWLLLGRGVPVFRPEVALDGMNESVDRALETLGNYFKQLHLELARAGTGLNAAGQIEPPAELFETPATESIVHEGTEAPARPAVNYSMGPVRVRMLLGPANGQTVLLVDSMPEEILICLNAEGVARLALPEQAGETGTMTYRRVLDRVYRWVTPAR